MTTALTPNAIPHEPTLATFMGYPLELAQVAPRNPTGSNATAHAKFDSSSDIAFVSSNGVRLLLDVGSAQCGEAVVTERLAVQVFDQGLVTRDLTAIHWVQMTSRSASPR
jgi:hypothetical protein